MTDGQLPVEQPSNSLPSFLDHQFNLGFGPGSQPAVHTDIDYATGVLDALRDKIRRQVQGDIVVSAVETDVMKGRIADSILQELQAATTPVDGFLDRIQFQLLEPIGQALEMSVPLGVIPLMPGNENPKPDSVLIHESALLGNVRPAVEKYTCDAFPRVLIKDSAYYNAVSRIQGYLYDTPDQLVEFNSVVRNAEITNTSPVDVICRSSVGGSSSAPTPSPASAAASAPTGTPTIAPQDCEYLESGGGSYFFADSSGAAWTNPESFPACFNPVNWLTDPKGILYVSFGWCPQTAGLSQLYLYGNKATFQPGGMKLRATTVDDGTGKVLFHFEGQTADSLPWYDIGTFAGPCEGGGGETPPPYEPPPYVPPTDPPYPVPDPTPVTPGASCEKPLFIKWCPEKEKECPPPEYCVYQTNEGTCYVIDKDEKPHSGADKQIACGDVTAIMNAASSGKCTKAKPPEPCPGPSGTVGVITTDIAGCSEFGAVPGIDAPNGLGDIAQIFGIRKPDGSLNVPPIATGDLSVAGLVINTLWGAGALALDQFGKLAQNIVLQSGCTSGQQVGLSLASAVVGFLNQFTDGAFRLASTPIKQQSNFLCPVALPSSQSATTAWLGNTIDDATLECWVRANGERFPEAARVIDACRTKLSPFQLGQLYQRKVIAAGDYAERIRETGMIRGNDAGDVLELLKQIPAVSDLVRFMVRDTNDEALVQKFGMDDQFNTKFGSDISDWADKQGVDSKFMRYAWRAHWSIPAPGQLFEMYHRLRNLPDDDSRKVSDETIREALVQQDILPFWVDKFIAISFRPLSRIDARRAYQIGSINRTQLRQAWSDQGYDDKNADILVEFTDKQRIQQVLRSPWINRYSDGDVTFEEMINELSEEGLQDQDIPLVTRRANTKLAGKRRKRCIAAYRKRFLAGEFTKDDIQPTLHALGLSDQQALNIAGAWECELDAQGKNFSAAQLGQLLDDSLIDAADFIQRARRLGWNNDDAIILLRHWERRLGIKRTQSEERALQREQREAEKQARKIKSLAKEAATEAVKQDNNLAKAQRASTLRNRRILEASKNVANLWKTDIIDEIPWMNDMFKLMKSDYAVLSDEIIGGLVTVSQAKETSNHAEFEAALRVYIGNLLLLPEPV